MPTTTLNENKISTLNCKLLLTSLDIPEDCTVIVSDQNMSSTRAETGSLKPCTVFRLKWARNKMSCFRVTNQGDMQAKVFSSGEKTRHFT